RTHHIFDLPSAECFQELRSGVGYGKRAAHCPNHGLSRGGKTGDRIRRLCRSRRGAESMIEQLNGDPHTSEETSTGGCPQIDLALYDLSTHPAFRAWSTLHGEAARPRGIQILKFPRG